MTVKELLMNVPGAFNYLEAYNDEMLERKVQIWHNEKLVSLLESMDCEVLDHNLNGENWSLDIYIK